MYCTALLPAAAPTQDAIIIFVPCRTTCQNLHNRHDKVAIASMTPYSPHIVLTTKILVYTVAYTHIHTHAHAHTYTHAHTYVRTCVHTHKVAYPELLRYQGTHTLS